MAYIQGGELKAKRSPWRLSILADLFWAIIFYVTAFCKTLFSIDEANAYRSRKPKSDRGFGYGGSGGGGGGGGGSNGGPPGNPGTGSYPKRFSEMSDVRGADHTATCGSCCG